MQSVSTQRQIDCAYFDLTNAFNSVPHSLLLRKLSTFGPSPNYEYVNWFRNYLTRRPASFHVLGIFSSHLYTMKSGAPQGSILGPLQFNFFINAICDSICNSSCLYFADDFKIFRSLEMLRTAKSCNPILTLSISGVWKLA
jgi:hypothetical protein